jgi:hypothetical protein
MVLDRRNLLFALWIPVQKGAADAAEWANSSALATGSRW